MNHTELFIASRPIFYITPANNLNPIYTLNVHMIYPSLLIMAIKIIEFIYFYN